MVKFFHDDVYVMSLAVACLSGNIITCLSVSFVGSKGSENELQTVLEEVTKIDPNFTVERFVRYCRLEVIPNVLEVSLIL